MSKYAEIRLNPIGVNYDIDPHLVDDSNYTDVTNMRFTDNSSQKIGGESEGTTTTAQATHLLFNGDHDEPYWLYFGDGIARVTDFTTDKDIEGTALSAGTYWDSSLFNLFPICNNTVDAPRYWDKDFVTPGTLADLTAWPTNHLCKAIRPFRSFLVAMNITVTGTGTEVNRVLWSDSSDAGAIPASWDITDPSTLAGDAYLTDDRGEIIDGAQLRDMFVIYKTHSTYIMRLIGGQSVMRIDKVQVNSGLLTKNCVVEFKGTHFVVTDGDIALFDGQNIESIADKRVREKIFTNLDGDNYINAYVVRNDREKEIWFCYPTTGQTYSDKAAIWNWEDNTWTYRDLTNTRHISPGVTNFVLPTIWDTATTTWDTYTGTWKAFATNPTEDALASAVTRIGDELISDPSFDNAASWTGTGLVTGGQGILDLGEFLSPIPNITSIVGTKYLVTANVASGTTLRVNFGGLASDFSVGTTTNTMIPTSATGLAIVPIVDTTTVNSLSVVIENTSINTIGSTFDIDGDAMPSKLEKVTMDLGSPDEVKLVKSVTPRITANAGTKIYIRIGTQFKPDDDITWGSEVLYTVGTDREAHFIAAGRYISVRMRTQDIGANWQCHGFYIKAKTSGKY